MIEATRVDEDHKYQYHADRLSELRKDTDRLDASFDDKLISISGGAIALSFTFLGLFEGEFANLELLTYALIFFGATIFLILFSQRILMFGNNKRTGIWKNWYLSNETELPNLHTWYDRINIPVMWSATLLFFFGVVFYSSTVIINLNARF